jgi:hypothetical protein
MSTDLHSAPRNTTGHPVRRDLLKLLGTGGVGIAALEALPARWTKPIVESVILPVHAQSSVGGGPVNFQSATLGPTGQTGGYSLTDQFLGVRFTLASPATTSAIGIHADGTGTIWGAIVRLTGPADFPDSANLSTPDVLGTAVLTVSASSSQVQAPLVLNLAAGNYALIFGDAGLFGSSGSGAAPSNNVDVGAPSYFFLQTPGNTWANGGFTSVRMFVI